MDRRRSSAGVRSIYQPGTYANVVTIPMPVPLNAVRNSLGCLWFRLRIWTFTRHDCLSCSNPSKTLVGAASRRGTHEVQAVRGCSPLAFYSSTAAGVELSFLSLLSCSRTRRHGQPRTVPPSTQHWRVARVEAGHPSPRS